MTPRGIWLASSAIVPVLASGSQAVAQTVTLEPPQLRQVIDAQGVDLATGELVMPSSSVSIGGELGLTHRRYRVANGWRHNYILSIAEGSSTLGATLRVQIGGSLREFLVDNGNYNPLNGENGTLVSNAAGYLYTDAGGTEYQFDTAPVANSESYYEAVLAVGSTITRPNGYVTSLTYRGDSYDDGGGMTLFVVRLQSVNSSTGYQLKYSYAENTPTAANVDDWYALSRVTAINNADEHCDPSLDACNLTKAWPYINYSVAAIPNNETMEYVTDQANRTVQFRIDQNDRLVGVRHAGRNEHSSVSYDANNRVYVHVNFLTGYRRDYAWSNDPQGNLVVTARDHADTDRARTVVTDPSILQVLTDTDADGRTTTYDYDNDGRLTSVFNPGGNGVEYDYDVLGRMHKITHVGKPGSPGANPDKIVVTELTFPSNCSNPVTCYKPTSSKDALGNVTDYLWWQDHGGLRQVQLPAPTPGDPRPTTVIYYGTYNARYKDGSGALVDGAPLTLTYVTYQCRIAATCFGDAEELRTFYAYTSSGAHNLNLAQVTQMAGNASISRAAKYTYDEVGNLETVDGPLPGTDDTVTYRYDNAYQLVGTISPDPDGAGPKPHLAERTTYDSRGILTKVESGTVTGTDDAAWAAFSPYQEYNNALDAYGRTVSVTHKVPGGAEISRTDYGYDYAGRMECTAVRMNPTTWGSATDACVQSSSANTDRISQSYFDLNDRVFQSWSGVGTPLAQATTKLQYGANGEVLWVEDAKGNRTGYTYDDHYRTTEIAYPDPSNPGTVSTTDTESITYDDAGNIKTFTDRMGELFNFTYDDLNRLTLKDVPNRAGLAAVHKRDVHYAYNLFGQLTHAKFDNAATGDGVTLQYDILGRNYYQYLDMAGETRGVSKWFDAADRVTQISHPDSQLFRYGYDVLGRLDKVVQHSGNVTLVGTGYSNVGNLTQVYRSPGAMRTNFAYDAAGRLSSRNLNVSGGGGTHDTLMANSYNAANQLTVETNSNAAYAAGGLNPTQIAYAANGLNQYTTVASNGLGYDANGNLVSDGSNTYTYDSENRLVEVSGQNEAELTYDPLGRLWQVEDGVGNKRRLLYDGDALIAEAGPGSNFVPTKRYVHGISAGDDPLVMYNGATVSLANARFLYSDMRGSIIAEADDSGIADVLPRYDEFGVHMSSSGTPGIPSTPSRFGFTGQAWVPEAGLYYYKARMYSPGLGRFMQTDPIGYGDGMNIYRYVGNNPVNAVDPTGLEDEIVVTGDRGRPVEVPTIVVTGQRGGGGCGLGCTSYAPPPFSDIGSITPPAGPQFGNGGGGSGNGNLQDVAEGGEEETEPCRVLREAAEAAIAKVPTRNGLNGGYRDNSFLRQQQARYRANARDQRILKGAIGLGGVIVGGLANLGYVAPWVAWGGGSAASAATFPDWVDYDGYADAIDDIVRYNDSGC